MFPRVIALTLLALHCAADLCNWTGSGFTAGMDSRIVLQVRLGCTEGSVRWIYPGQALRVVLDSSLSSAWRSIICIKPFPSIRGVNVFTERGGHLELLAEKKHTGLQVLCFRPDEAHTPAIYLQASPRPDGSWSRRVMGFRYELMRNRSSALGEGNIQQTTCRPCNTSELLLAVCSSDFMVRGHITSISQNFQRQTSVVVVSATKVYWQRGAVFEQQAVPAGPSAVSPSFRGHIHTWMRCHVKPGDGEFLFTGSEHFGEAWLGCAPRYTHFLSVYLKARAEHQNSCDFPAD